MIRIVELGFAVGEGQETSSLSSMNTTKQEEGKLYEKLPLGRSIYASHLEFIKKYPELADSDGRRFDPEDRSAAEWLIEVMRKTGEDKVASYSSLQLICLAHSTISPNILHAPVARIKHELGARKALPFAVGQAQTLAAFFSLQFIQAWDATSPELPPETAGLLAAVEKRRSPLMTYFSKKNLINNAVSFAEVRTGPGVGLKLMKVQVDRPLLKREEEGFDSVLDDGNKDMADRIAASLLETVNSTLGSNANVIAAGPNIKGYFVEQVAAALAKMSDGRVRHVSSLNGFYMNADPIASLRHLNTLNDKGAPSLVWSVDQRLSLGKALFEGRVV